MIPRTVGKKDEVSFVVTHIDEEAQCGGGPDHTDYPAEPIKKRQRNKVNYAILPFLSIYFIAHGDVSCYTIPV